MTRCRVSLACVGLLLGTALIAQPQDPVFRSSVDVVLVNVLVTDNGRPVAGLRAEDFEVLDSGVPQRVTVTGTENGVDVGVLLDVSGSVSGKPLTHLIAAGQALLGSLTPRDRVSLVTFSERIGPPAYGPQEAGAILAGLTSQSGGGRTALYDAVYVGLSAVGRTSPRPSLLLALTDGLDTASWLQTGQLVEAFERGHSTLYVVGRPDLYTPITNIALLTGGRIYPATGEKLTKTFVEVLTLFRAGYLISFTPEGVKRGDGFHSLTVRLRSARGEVSARRGYRSR